MYKIDTKQQVPTPKAKLNPKSLSKVHETPPIIVAKISATKVVMLEP